MRVAVDISLYPLTDDFIPPIQDVIQRLNTHESIEVVTNPMSTQLRGEYDDVMSAISQEVKTSFENSPKVVFAIKILNNPISD
jgi:uncharacterized protein YqgV (UPF0045/DUF77 family)